MTIVVQTHVTGQPTRQIVVSDSAMDAVRVNFNPSGLEEVIRLKCLSSAFITQCEELQRQFPHAAREFAVAITNMQTASMWSVLGATKQAPKPVDTVEKVDA